MNSAMNTASEYFELSMPCDLGDIQGMLVEEPGRIFGNYGEVRITSCFQPVFSLAHGKPVGFEALLRAQDADDKPVSPMLVFDQSAEFDEILRLDRLSCTVHVSNFQKQANAEGWLFVNMNPQVFIESAGRGAFLADLLDRYKVPPNRLVIELLEESEIADDALAEAIAACRAGGSLVAFDDFSASEEDLDRVWALRPDIVKINRGLAARAVGDRKSAHALAAAVRSLHDMGCIALLQGVETEAEAELALEHQIDLVEGYFLGRPEFEIPAHVELCSAAVRFGDGYRRRALSSLQAHRDHLAAYLSGVWNASALLESGTGLQVAVAGLSALAATISCYLVDAEGRQVGESAIALKAKLGPPAFARLRHAASASHAHRPCFRNAWARPGQMQVTESEFGALAGNPRFTLSTTVRVAGTQHVLCAELDWDLIGGK
jgi:EAL domain-containing protein (putative c-di-GMP-specific phosphodiesterase class I)